MRDAAEFGLEALFIVATMFATTFPILYLVLPWSSTPQGRAIQHFAMGVALLMNLTLLFAFWTPEDYWVFWAIEFAALLYVTWAAGYRSFVLIRDIREHWGDEGDQPPLPPSSYASDPVDRA